MTNIEDNSSMSNAIQITEVSTIVNNSSSSELFSSPIIASNTIINNHRNNNHLSSPRSPTPPVTNSTSSNNTLATLVLKDGSSFQGFSFGAEVKSVSGECVFQTGMVGYPESLTDPSYRGQILVLTFPLIGNYGVPSRDEMDDLNLKKYFESYEIHITGLIIGQYSQDFSHYLAKSSLSDWLKENNVPALYGIDTRALTKKIRTKGVLLGKILFPKSVVGDNLTSFSVDKISQPPWINDYQDVPWIDPNDRNLVAEGIIPTYIFFCTIHSI
jgi:carbamoyl-phosphate synthase/aspartate carbamoyltransferase